MSHGDDLIRLLVGIPPAACKCPQTPQVMRLGLIRIHFQESLTALWVTANTPGLYFDVGSRRIR